MDGKKYSFNFIPAGGICEMQSHVRCRNDGMAQQRAVVRRAPHAGAVAWVQFPESVQRPAGLLQTAGLTGASAYVQGNR